MSSVNVTSFLPPSLTDIISHRPLWMTMPGTACRKLASPNPHHLGILVIYLLIQLPFAFRKSNSIPSPELIINDLEKQQCGYICLLLEIKINKVLENF